MNIQSLIVLSSVPFVAMLAASRASVCGISPDHRAHQLTPGLLIATPIVLYALLVSDAPGAAPADLLGSLLLRVSLGGVLLAALGAARWSGLRLLFWVDICVPAVLLGLAAVSVGAAVAQGLPPALILATLWQLGMIWALLWAERLLRGWLRPGDTLLIAGMLAAPGALMGVVLHAQRLCREPQLAACQEVLGGAPPLTLALGLACASLLALRRAWRQPAPGRAGPRA